MKDQEEILKENPGSIIFARYAEELAREGRIDDALRILEKGIEANPHYAPGYSVLADILDKQDAEEKAAEELKTSIHLDPQMPKNLLSLGRYFIKQNQPEKAMPYLWAAHRFEPHVPEVQNAYDKARLLEETPEDLDLGEQTEKVFSELTEGEETEGAEITETKAAGVEDTGVTDSEALSELSTGIGVSGEESKAETREAPEKEISESEETILAGVNETADEIFDESEPQVQKPEEIPEPIEDILSETGKKDDEALEEIGKEGEQAVSEIEEEITPPESSEAEESLTEDLSSLIESFTEDTGASVSGEAVTGEIPAYTEMPEGEQETIVGSGIKPEDAGVLEIDEDEEYDLSRYELDISASGIGEESLINDEERAELLTYESTSEQVEAHIMEDFEIPEIEADDTQKEIIEGTEPRAKDEEEPEIETGEFYSELTREELDVLSDSGIERESRDRDLEFETKEGIDYSDILTESKFPPDSEEPRMIDLEEMGQAAGEESIPSDSGFDVQDLSRAEIDEGTVDETGDVLTREEVEPAPSALPEEIHEAETPDESLRIVEELITNAPDIELRDTEEKKEDVTDISLDELISDYEASIKEDSELLKREEPPSGRKENAIDTSTLESSETRENATATMAEIYVSQGLISRAIDIYQTLLAEEPDNETMKSRLEELRELSDQQSDES